MDFKGLLNQVLSSGSSLASDGKSKLEKGLNIPSSGSERSAMLSGMGKGALAGGALSLLLGSKKGRKLAGTAAGAGGAAALGALALKTYKDWKSNQSDASGQSHDEMKLLPENEERQSLVILQAMIAAAKADGHVDDEEKARIQEVVKSLGATAEVNQFVQQELEKPLDPAEVAREVYSPEEAAEVYLASLLVVDEQNFMEKAYLQELARQLELESGLVEKLEAQVQNA
ncbi:tellurite resistance TerB family protein [Endozoicomonas arenosclerae]|uniref:tellurite resistance TerB family protein n=1 Tax=Endozoicomonas arenosclerae TaxID=1633495 RepID=UPI00078577D2|nr:tellurite resistance TerB family protein [Endozoicomonas arenosclerae]